MRALLAVTWLMLPTLALADADPRFAKLRDQAEALTSLSGFIEKYSGNCASALMGGADCAKAAEAYRKATTGKKFYMIVTEETAGVLQMGEVNRDGTVILNLTPFFGGAGSALTHGAPTKSDAQGNPVLPFLRIEAKLPDGWNPAMMARQVSARAMRLQVVFTPQGLWTLSKKGGGALKGVKARFDVIHVSVGRTGEEVGLWLPK